MPFSKHKICYICWRTGTQGFGLDSETFQVRCINVKACMKRTKQGAK